jgi:hypothetical protein
VTLNHNDADEPASADAALICDKTEVPCAWNFVPPTSAASNVRESAILQRMRPVRGDYRRSNELEKVVMSLDNLAEQIRKRAYEIWEDEGRPHGRDMQHWVQAETEFHPRLRVVNLNDPLPAAPKKPARKRTRKPPRK